LPRRALRRRRTYPVGPPFFRFADEEQFAALLEHSGLTGVEVKTIVFEHHVSTTDELWNGFLGATVRISALIVRQPDQTRQRPAPNSSRIAPDTT
jgi:hypothetical protein